MYGRHKFLYKWRNSSSEKSEITEKIHSRSRKNGQNHLMPFFLPFISIICPIAHNFKMVEQKIIHLIISNNPDTC